MHQRQRFKPISIGQPANILQTASFNAGMKSWIAIGMKNEENGVFLQPGLNRCFP